MEIESGYGQSLAEGRFVGAYALTNPKPTGDTTLDFVEGRDCDIDREFKSVRLELTSFLANTN